MTPPRLTTLATTSTGWPCVRDRFPAARWLLAQAFFAAESEVLRTHHLYGDDSPDPPALPGSLSGESDSATTSQVTLTAPNTPSTSVVVSVVVTDDLGASKKHDFSLHTAAAVTACTPPASTAWSFGVMSDTQWIGTDDGKNPRTVAVDITLRL